MSKRPRAGDTILLEGTVLYAGVTPGPLRVATKAGDHIWVNESHISAIVRRELRAGDTVLYNGLNRQILCIHEDPKCPDTRKWAVLAFLTDIPMVVNYAELIENSTCAD